MSSYFIRNFKISRSKAIFPNEGKYCIMPRLTLRENGRACAETGAKFVPSLRFSSRNAYLIEVNAAAEIQG